MLEEIVLPDGTTRRLGNIIPTDGKLRYTWREYGAANDEPIIARSEWPALIAALPAGPADSFLPYVHDQDGVGQCNCDATTAACEGERLMQGLPFVKLSAADLYDRINGGSDNGSLLEDALAEMTKNGVGTADTAGTIWKRGMKTASAEERSRFKVLEFVLYPTFDHVMSGALKGRRGISGIMWYDNYKPDGDGWLPSRGSGQPGGHAIFSFKAAMSKDGKFGIWHRQSWGEKWSPQTDNCFVVPESAFAGQVGGWWGIRSMVDEGGVIPGS